MSKLLSAGFSRLWKSKIFWIGMVIIAGFMALVIYSNYKDAMSFDEAYRIAYTSDIYLTGSFMFIGCFTAIFAALFLGTEYSDGTIRNKLVVGHSRISVYLSSLILCFTSSLLVCAAAALVAFAIGVPLFGMPVQPLLILQKFAVGIILTASYAGLFTLCAMLIHNKPVLSVICIIGFFVMVFASIYIMNRLEAPEFISGYELSMNGDVVPTEPYPNPGYLRGTARAVYEFLQDFLPTSQSFQIGQTGALSHPWLLVLYSTLITFCTTLGGIVLFRRKDLK